MWYNVRVNNRDYKNFSKGGIYHIYNRGNNKGIIFHDEQDYRALLFRLGLALGINKKNLDQCPLTLSSKSRIRIGKLKSQSFKIHAFCLMPNHLHILIEQCGEESISKLIHKVFTSFSKYINLKYKRVGHIFQDRFKAVQIGSNPQLMLVSSYIHMNPVKDLLVEKPEEYKWSSYSDFVSLSQKNHKNPIVYTDFLIKIFGNSDTFVEENTRLYNVSKTAFDILDVL